MSPTNARLQISEPLFLSMISELARRGGGTRESGAFLLSRRENVETAEQHVITAIAYYDDLDPSSLNGAIAFTASGYSALGTLCRQEALRVVADIHTHPGHRVAQSRTDASHPMVAVPGHVALIAPEFALRRVTASDLGVHVFMSGGVWTSFYGPDVARVLRVRRPRIARRICDRLRTSAGRVVRRQLSGWRLT
jgi:proteasome lid subunit RPN8/RPN11